MAVHKKWMPGFRCILRDENGEKIEPFYDSKGRLDLADNFMLHWYETSRSAYIQLRQTPLSGSTERARKWTERFLSEVEQNIRYDMEFEGYEVAITRLSEKGTVAVEPFIWALKITLASVAGDEELEWVDSDEEFEAEQPAKRNLKPVRYKRAKSHARLTSITRRIARDYGLPAGAIQINLPGSKRPKDEATVGDVRKQWEAKGVGWK